MPKGVLGIRVYGENYKELNRPRNMGAIRLMYGLTSRLSIWVQGTTSNHHDTLLPKDLVNHTHVGNQTTFYTQTPGYGRKYPYRFNGFSFYAKYRLISLDAQNRHFRAALYLEGSRIKSAHDEAEPSLVDDNSGYGGGIILTQLYKRFAVTFTGGYVKPAPYSEMWGHDKIKLFYGDAFSYDLSFGYLVYPEKYKNYEQDNYNIYVELMGKTYKEAVLLLNSERVEIQTVILKSGHYIEGRFGVQRIINSNDRLDFSIGIPLLNLSYTRFYPLYSLGWQRYLYFNKSRQKKAIKARLQQGQSRRLTETEQLNP